ncbi:MAG: glycosyltransferase family 4 protein [Gemmatimonadaceae bacterium]
MTERLMRIALVADAYKPLRSSAAVQIRDLAHELAAQGHSPTVIVPAIQLERDWSLENDDGVEVLRVSAPRTKDVGNVRRVLSELLLPYVMLRRFSQSPLSGRQWDAVVWYSPSIFLGPLVSRLKRAYHCPSYLILRDMFPEWAVDTGVIGRGPAFHLFKRVARYQYSLADTIGVQSPANLGLFDGSDGSGQRRVEVLNNWLAEPRNAQSPVLVSETTLAGRTIFVYAGNMGVSQDMPAVLRLAERMQSRQDAGFFFVGRGTEVDKLRALAMQMKLDNTLFHGEIEPWEVPGMLAQCHIGIVTLDLRHKTHNVPGKFLNYLQAGLPVLARLNPGNDLEKLIRDEGVGLSCSDPSIELFHELAVKLLDDRGSFEHAAARGKELAQRMFSVRAAAAQIVDRLQNSNGQ